MNYFHFNEEDFAADAFFQQWVISPDAETESFWQKWLSENPEKQPIVKKARWLVQHISFNETWTETERGQLWQSIQSKLEPVQETARPVVPLWQRPNRWRWLAAASVVLLLVSFGFFYTRLQPTEIATSFGEIRDIRLADGSVVTLNANSKLHFTRNFPEEATREIWIEGEAFFEVAKRTVDGKRVPFVVHANNLSVQVLGTAFNVINRRGKVDVALEHGSVKVVDEQNNQNTVLLKPGEKVSQTDEKAMLVKAPVQIEEYTSWKNKVILFKEKSLVEITEMMKDLYDIDVIIDNPALRRETFTGSFPADSAEVFFKKLKRMYPIEISGEGKRFHLR